jgi:hypothetical protein
MFSKKIYIVVYIVEVNLRINFQFFHLEKILIIIELLNLKFCVMFK